MMVTQPLQLHQYLRQLLHLPRRQHLQQLLTRNHIEMDSHQILVIDCILLEPLVLIEYLFSDPVLEFPELVHIHVVEVSGDVVGYVLEEEDDEDLDLGSLDVGLVEETLRGDQHFLELEALEEYLVGFLELSIEHIQPPQQLHREGILETGSPNDILPDLQSPLDLLHGRTNLRVQQIPLHNRQIQQHIRQRQRIPILLPDIKALQKVILGILHPLLLLRRVLITLGLPVIPNIRVPVPYHKIRRSQLQIPVGILDDLDVLLGYLLSGGGHVPLGSDLEEALQDALELGHFLAPSVVLDSLFFVDEVVVFWLGAQAGELHLADGLSDVLHFVQADVDLKEEEGVQEELDFLEEFGGLDEEGVLELDYEGLVHLVDDSLGGQGDSSARVQGCLVVLSEVLEQSPCSLRLSPVKHLLHALPLHLHLLVITSIRLHYQPLLLLLCLSPSLLLPFQFLLSLHLRPLIIVLLILVGGELDHPQQTG